MVYAFPYMYFMLYVLIYIDLYTSTQGPCKNCYFGMLSFCIFISPIKANATKSKQLFKFS